MEVIHNNHRLEMQRILVARCIEAKQRHWHIARYERKWQADQTEFLQASAICQTAAGGPVLSPLSGSGERLPSPMGWIDFQERVRMPAIVLVVLAVSKLLVAATCVGES